MSRMLLNCLGVLLCCPLLLTGCAKTGDVSGAVVCNGKPVLSGTVMVSPIPGLVIYGRIEKDGTFVVKDVPVGESLVAVNSPKIVAAPGKEPPPRVLGWHQIPAKFNDLVTSGLKYVVEEGENTYDIQLVGPVNDRR